MTAFGCTRTTQRRIKIPGLSVAGSISQEILVPDVTLSINKTKLITNKTYWQFIAFKIALLGVVFNGTNLFYILFNHCSVTLFNATEVRVFVENLFISVI